MPTLRQELIAILPRLRRYAYTLTGSVEDGDDLVQSACERALEKDTNGVTRRSTAG